MGEPRSAGAVVMRSPLRCSVPHPGWRRPRPGPPRRSSRRSSRDDPPQPQQRAVLGYPHRPRRRPDRLGRLFRRQPDGQPQHQHLPLARRQVRQQRPQRGVALGVQHAAFRAFGSDRGIGQLGDGLSAVAADRPKRVGDLVRGDAVDERPERQAPGPVGLQRTDARPYRCPGPRRPPCPALSPGAPTGPGSSAGPAAGSAPAVPLGRDRPREWRRRPTHPATPGWQSRPRTSRAAGLLRPRCDRRRRRQHRHSHRRSRHRPPRPGSGPGPGGRFREDRAWWVGQTAPPRS